MRHLKRTEWIAFALIVAFSFIPVIGGLIRVLELAGGPQIAPENPRALLSPAPIILHIFSSVLFCIAGAFQFFPSIRRHHPVAHRLIGRAVAIAGCVAAISGLWMTLFFAFPETLQGRPLYWVRIVLGVLMIGFIIGAVIAIRSRNVFQHSAAMLRAYAIGQGASTQTFVGISWIIFAGYEATGPARDGLMIGSWVINLLAAEIVIWTALRPTNRSSKT